ncbi:MAG: ComF family protein [Firmicutes bacterium]|nr:ComF family protein [Bacillota bacterium]
MRVAELLLDILYPPKCTICHRAYGKLDEVGKERKERLGLCPLCDIESYRIGFDESGNDHIRAAFRYEGAVRKAISELKYHGRKSYAGYFARWMLEDPALKEWVSTFDLLSAVPVSKERYQTRGYNQAEELAVRMSEVVHVPYRQLVQRKRNTKAQKGLNKNERIINLQGAFCLSDDVERMDFSPYTRVLMIDDICTTGSTLELCRKVILDAFPSFIVEALAFSSENEDFA